MRLLGLNNVATHLRGDSESSLRWAIKDRTLSMIARRANIAFTLVAAMNDITVQDLTHIPGEVNKIYGGLTRQSSASDVGLPPELQVHFPPAHPVVEFIALCDPDSPLETYTQHVELSNALISLLTDHAMVLPHNLPSL
jgi:hypothetical protein